MPVPMERLQRLLRVFITIAQAFCAPAVLFILTLGTAAGQGYAPQKDECLRCHGTLESFVAREVRFTVDGVTINPHRYFPHDSKKASDFPACTLCHDPHPLPPPKGYKDASANVYACYQCHHNHTFKRCSQCHE